MQTVTLDEAKTQLPDLFKAAAAGEEVIITDGDEVSVQLVPKIVRKVFSRKAGSAKGLIFMGPEFDEPLEEFKDYM